jgi:probable phosphoglycerate mutase
MGRLVLIRHGESEGNRDRCFTLTPDVPMTPVGHEQVRRRGGVGGDALPALAIVTSPFRRARETAAIIAARLGLDVRVEQDLAGALVRVARRKPYAAARACADYDPAAYWLWCPPTAARRSSTSRREPAGCSTGSRPSRPPPTWSS